MIKGIESIERIDALIKLINKNFYPKFRLNLNK